VLLTARNLWTQPLNVVYGTYKNINMIPTVKQTDHVKIAFSSYTKQHDDQGKQLFQIIKLYLEKIEQC